MPAWFRAGLVATLFVFAAAPVFPVQSAEKTFKDAALDDAAIKLEAELKEYVKKSLAPYKYPRWIEFVEALPRGPGGKLLRYKLRPQRRRRRAETGSHEIP